MYTYRMVWESLCVLWNVFVLSKSAAVRSIDCSLEWHHPTQPLPRKVAECKHIADSAKAKKGIYLFFEICSKITPGNKKSPLVFLQQPETKLTEVLLTHG